MISPMPLNIFIRRIMRQFNLLEDMESEEQILINVRKDADFRGANLWVLILAIVIASVGLNVNSTAVIIGAMLISPLMGPLIAIGVGVSIQDFDLLKLAARNLGFALLASLVASTLYFLLTPLDQPQTEIINRTTPTIFDVFIALAGGLAGMIAVSRKTRGNVLPGVAIATALMPPLCTAGFGLASWNLEYFFGAFYLFFINCVFIFLGTFIVVKFLHFKEAGSVDKFLGLRIQRIITAVAIFTILPSGFLAYRMVQRSLLDRKIDAFLLNEVSQKGLIVIEKKIDRVGNVFSLKITATGQQVPDQFHTELESKLSYYALSDLKLKFNYLGMKSGELDSIKKSLRAEFQGSRSEKSASEKEIAVLEAELIARKKFDLPQAALKTELKVLFPGLQKVLLSLVDDEGKVVLIGSIVHTRKVLPKERGTISDWLRVRTKADLVRVSFDEARSKIPVAASSN